jgi:hypothetical protein
MISSRVRRRQVRSRDAEYKKLGAPLFEYTVSNLGSYKRDK